MNDKFNNIFNKFNLSKNQQLKVQNFTSINSNINGTSKKNSVLSIAIITLAIGFIGIIFILKSVSFKNSKLSVNMVKIGDDVVALKKGEELNVNAWNPPIEIILNDEKLKTKKIPRLYNGVTLGTHVRDVIRKFNIKSGYAILNMETSTEENDGTTDIVNKSFKNYNSIPKHFLDCAIIYGYNKVNDEWKMVKEKDIKNADIIYYIDINGFSDEMYDTNEVIEFNIEYKK